MLFNIFRKYGYKIYEESDGKFTIALKVPRGLWPWRYIHIETVKFDTAAGAIYHAQYQINLQKTIEKFPKLLGTFKDGEINIDNIPVGELYHENAKCDGR